MLVGLLTLAIALLVPVGPAVADTYPFGDSVRQTGPEQAVFDWTNDAVCDQYQYADLPARAFRDNLGRVQLSFSHFTNRRLIGADLNSVEPENADCHVVLGSSRNPDPSKFDDREWISSTYTPDGQTVYALVHMEYHGLDYGICASGVDNLCWYNAVTLAVSSNPGDPGGAFTQASPPGHLVASLPYQYDPNRSSTVRIPYGYLTPGNIVENPTDNRYYAFVWANPYRDQQNGICLMRTSDLGDPTSWRAWDGTDFSVRFANPYPTAPALAGKYLCQPLDFERLFRITSSLTYNTHFDKWIAVGVSRRFSPSRDEDVWGVYYSLSDDLIRWSDRKLLMEAPPWACGGFDPINYPSLLDPASTSRNFSTTGRSGFLYFTRWNANQHGCDTATSDRDLMRIPFEFNERPRASPSVPSSVVAGRAATFDASASTDPDGSIARYEWDFDGDGTFETDGGSSPTISHTFDFGFLGRQMVGLRVTDAEGKTDQEERPTTVSARVNFQPAGSAVPSGYVKDSGSPYGDASGSGWVREDALAGAHTPLDLTLNTRERDRHADQRLDTLIHMQYPLGSPPSEGDVTRGGWELAVPNGAYRVRVSVGDPLFDPGVVERDWINVEGQSAIRDFVPTSAQTHASATVFVSVGDGRLTVDAIGGTNTKLDYVDVDSLNSLPEPSFTISATSINKGESSSFDASGSSDPDGSIARYEWDLDGNGSFEVDSGSTPTIATGHPELGTLSVAPLTPGYISVRLRVTDDDGASAETLRVLTVNAKVNFQPYGATIPTGYARDAGWAWTDSRGSGWVRQDSLGSQTHAPLGLIANVRERNVASDQRLDTFVHMQYPAGEPVDGGVTTPGAWEISVPLGTYRVTATVGDPSFSSGAPERDWINVEGQNLIRDFVPTTAQPSLTATATVAVTDGRLTIDAVGGTNTKLDYVDIAPVATYPRPNGAARVRVNFVPALRECTAPNTSHAASLALDSCSPSQAIAGYAAVKNDDSSIANGTARYQYVCTNGTLGDPACGASGDQADISLNARHTDVRQKQNLALDYTGELEARMTFRITDSYNGSGTEKATTTQADFSVTLPCTPSPSDPATGSLCAVNTGLDAISPGVVLEDKRAIWEIGNIELYDGGADADGDTTADNTLFATQGIAIP